MAYTTRLMRWKQFGRDIDAVRKAEGDSLREFAINSQIDKAAVCRAQQGKVVSVANFLALCNVCNLDPWSYFQRASPEGPAGDRGQVGWMGGEYDR